MVLVSRSLCLPLVVVALLVPVCAQSNKPEIALENLKEVVISDNQSGSEIAIPLSDSMRSLNPSTAKAIDVTSWLQRVVGVNGLDSPGLQPWHIVVNYDYLDEHGGIFDSGVFEEYWAGPKKYKSIYKSKRFNQTDYATPKGLFRSGDQRWPGRAEFEVRSQLADPFFLASDITATKLWKVSQHFGKSTLDCFQFERKYMADPGAPLEYCFEPGTNLLRYSHLEGWQQTTYNRIELFQGHYIGREISINNGRRPFLRIHVKILEDLRDTADFEFTPPLDAVALSGTRLKGVALKRLKIVFPVQSGSMQGRHFNARVDIVVGKDGHVLSAHQASGPAEVRKACEDAAMKALYVPYKLLGEPVEVETTVEFIVF
jgi:hypothetical protein